MNELVISNNNAVSTNNAANPFLSFADAVSPRFVVGKLLRFAKGEYLAGETNEVIPLDTKMVAAVDSLLFGWVRWDNGKPVEHRMAQVAEGFAPPRRAELGFTDQSTWERDPNGNLRDPWALTYYLPMIDENAEAFTFSSTSRGGINAIADLARHYGNNQRIHASEFPVVLLKSDSYQHSNNQFGRIKFPVFKRVGWTAKKTFYEAIGAEDMLAPKELDADVYGVCTSENPAEGMTEVPF
jgi:hypothetical protein